MASDANARSGIVRALHDGRASIGVAAAACSGCGKKSGCAVGKLADGMKETRIEIDAPAGVNVGDAVTLEIDSEQLVGSAVLGYLLPAIGLLVGAGIGNALGGDAVAAAGAGLGLALGLLLARLATRRGDRGADIRVRLG